MKKTISLLMILMLLFLSTALADDSFNLNKDGYSTSYTYGYDYWGDVQESPDAYRVTTVLDSVSLELDVRLNKPQSLFVKDQDLYVCDTNNNRIVQIHREDDTYSVVRIIDEAHADERDYKLAETFHQKTQEYDSLIIEYNDAAKKIEEKKKKSDDSESENSEETEKQKQQEIDELNAEMAEIESRMNEAHDSAVEAEETARAAGCKIWRYEAWSEKDGEITTGLNGPNDIAVDNDGFIYIADTNNERILKLDEDCNVVWEYTKPLDSTFDQQLSFLPRKIVVDVAGRVYALITNVNKGIVKFDTDTIFTGYIGATPVSVSMVDYIWKKYFMTQAQRDASTSFVPTEYENIYIDKDDFIYATITNFSEYDLKSDAAKPIRKLNGLGNDILVKNDRYPPIGDLYWLEGDSTYFGPSKMTDVTVLDNDLYVVLDRVRGRLFGYESQGVMLWAFGTRGNTEGAFTSAVSLEHMGNDLFVLDQQENSITVFTPTEYGNKIYQAILDYQDGRYDASAEVWEDVLKQNANYPMAFRGIGRTLLRQDKYEDAMEYFKMAHDRENYGRVFKLYRKEWIEKNVWWIFLGLALLLVIPLIRGRIKRMKWEVMMHEHSKIHKNIG